jgi:hypothetical protein
LGFTERFTNITSRITYKLFCVCGILIFLLLRSPCKFKKPSYSGIKVRVREKRKNKEKEY